MPGTTRNRIKTHRQVRAGDLLPHEHNWRRHPEHQREAMQAILDEVGFARSLLAYERSDGRLMLIDGHLRRDLDPDALVTVEVLDVSDGEARKLLLTIDPLAALAEADQQAVAALARVTETDKEALSALWQSLEGAARQTESDLADEPVQQQFLVLIECDDEAQQAELLQRFHEEGLRCKALVS
jgi:ParB-like chromosome segregation protein Spo0J